MKNELICIIFTLCFMFIDILTGIVPEWNFGLHAGFSYRGVDFNVLFTGVANRSVYAYNNAKIGRAHV